ncbi:MAG: putative metal-binding motif-containing protein, partial [Myxococcota bacterium]
GDCDDTNADVRPDVPRDDCDGLDSDCNGFIDDVVDPLEPNDLPEQAVVITGTGQHQGLFSHDGDPVDIVRIVASEATSIRIGLFDLAVRVRVVDASGDEIAREENDATIRLELPDPTASPFLLFVEPLGPPGCDGSYSVSAEPSR